MKAGAPGGKFMAKATSRKHATHKKARAHHAAKTHTRRSTASRSSMPRPWSPSRNRRSPDEDFTVRPEPRVVDDELDDEVGIYGPNRGETAG